MTFIKMRAALLALCLVPFAACAQNPAAAPSAAAFVPRSVTILGSGDVLIHPPLIAQAQADAKAEGKTGYDFDAILGSIAPDVRDVDLAICELETPLAPPQGPFTGYPEFDVPPQVLVALKDDGYDECTTASNHSLDKGFAGIVRTLDELDAAGIRHTGSARTAKEADTPLIITLPNGVKVASLAYSYGFNDHKIPEGKSWSVNEIDVPKILAAAKRAKKAGADIVVLSLHWGTEYDHLATPTQLAQAKRLLASPDVDLILGDHAHVIQPMQKVGDKWVIYCMGNLVARHSTPIDDNREGVLAKFTFTEIRPHVFRASRAEAIPVWMQMTPQLRLIDLPRALADPATTPEQRAVYQNAWNRIAGYLDAYGAVKAGLVIK
ncbi:MAG TPA: CapA family protein [Rhodanobacteraceae bacterium]|nr:CapA family protein [Rhodanobacteraceae bacterium]